MLPDLTELQRHMAMLAAVSGEITYDCSAGPCVQGSSPGGNFTSASLLAFHLAYGDDPLLLDNAPATLIGWADHLTDDLGNTTINDFSTAKVQETMIQAPVDVTMNNPATLTEPLIQTQLADMQGQGTNVEMLSSSVYALYTGSITFEASLPNVANLHSSSLTVSLPSNLSQFAASSLQGSSPGDADSLQVYLYNWHTGKWDPFSFNSFTFTTSTSDQYISSDGHILIQTAIPTNSSNAITFGQPQVLINGSPSS
jgi:hypothetical protein